MSSTVALNIYAYSYICSEIFAIIGRVAGENTIQKICYIA
jgi:hypothetical protein